MNAHFVHLTLQHSCCHSKMRIIPSLEMGFPFSSIGVGGHCLSIHNAKARAIM